MPPVHHKIFVTPEQLATLVDFMERHGDLSIVSGKTAKNVLLWNELSGILNQIGVGPRKTVEQWKKTWSDLKYRTKEKVLKMQKASSARDRNLSVLTEVEIKELTERLQTAEEHKYSPENEETVDPVFIEFINHAESFSPHKKIENCPSRSPTPPSDTELRRKRKRRNSNEDSNESFKRETTSFSANNTINIEEENQTTHHRQLIELKRLELETLRENNLHEREKERTQMEREKFRETIKIQQQLITIMQDIKPALINFLNK